MFSRREDYTEHDRRAHRTCPYCLKVFLVLERHVKQCPSKHTGRSWTVSYNNIRKRPMEATILWPEQLCIETMDVGWHIRPFQGHTFVTAMSSWNFLGTDSVHEILHLFREGPWVYKWLKGPRKSPQPHQWTNCLPGHSALPRKAPSLVLLIPCKICWWGASVRYPRPGRPARGSIRFSHRSSRKKRYDWCLWSTSGIYNLATLSC